MRTRIKDPEIRVIDPERENLGTTGLVPARAAEYDAAADRENQEHVRAVLSAIDMQRLPGERPDLGATEVETLLRAQGPALEQLLQSASAIRDEGLRHAGRPGVITFSKKVFLPITNMCRDRCHYCTFVESPRQMLRQGKPLYMSPEQVLAVATQGAALGCKEALFTLGDRPEDRWPEARAWLDEHGYESTLHYVREMAQQVLDRTGLLPHLNPGVMTAEELVWLKPVAPSMGMMLETTSVELWSEKGRAHYGSPDKEPRVRLRVIEDAGRAQVPFTTGILVGIGETMRDRAESLIAIRELNDRYGHVQEMIVQNFRAKPHTAMQTEADLDTVEYLAAIATARLVMGPEARLQVPPNLANHAELELLVRAGIDDWGGVSPLTADHVNPERPWPSILALRESTAQAGFELRERLTVYPPYMGDAGMWVDPRLAPAIAPLAEPTTGLARENVKPRGLNEACEATAYELAMLTNHSGSAAHANPIRAALFRARRHPDAISDVDLSILLGATGEELDEVVSLADQARRYSVGETVTIVANGTIDPSGFCEEAGRSDGLVEISRLARELESRGATEICVQGKAPESWGRDAYLEIANAVKSATHGIHLHAFRPADIVDGAARAGVTVADYLSKMRNAGVDTVPGTGVKLLDDRHRRRVAPTDLAVEKWESTILAAHRAGFRSTAVIVYGLGERPADRVRHLRRLERIQKETGGFTELVVMSPPSGWLPLVPGRSELDEHRAMHAVARLAVGVAIRHIQTGWPRFGVRAAAEMLRSGADDLGGTLLSVGSVSGGGAPHEFTMDDVDLVKKHLARPIRRRTTLYGVPEGAGSLVSK